MRILTTSDFELMVATDSQDKATVDVLDSVRDAQHNVKGPGCKQCTGAGLRCVCVQHNGMFRIHKEPGAPELQDEGSLTRSLPDRLLLIANHSVDSTDTRPAEWVRWLSLAKIAICDDRRLDSPFVTRYLSPSYTHLGVDVDCEVVSDDPDARDKFHQYMRSIKTATFSTAILDCEVMVDRQKQEAISWVAMRHNGVIEESPAVGQEVLMKYKWLQRKGVWQCYGFAGIRGPGCWTTPDIVPIETAHFLEADTNGSLLRMNEHNFRPRRNVKKRSVWDQRESNGCFINSLYSCSAIVLNWAPTDLQTRNASPDQDAPEDRSTTSKALGSFHMLVAEQKRRDERPATVKRRPPTMAAGMLSVLAIFPHIDGA